MREIFGVLIALADEPSACILISDIHFIRLWEATAGEALLTDVNPSIEHIVRHAIRSFSSEHSSINGKDSATTLT